MKIILLFVISMVAVSCYDAERNCADFKTGKFKSEITVNGVKHETVSERTETMVVETYNGKTDTASVRWINDCEYVLQQLHPKNSNEKKAVDIKILTTSKNSYTFEFGVVGSDQKLRGKATLIN